MSNNHGNPKARGRPKGQRAVSIDKGGSKPKQEYKEFDIESLSPFDEDRHQLIAKISTLDNKQLRGILPIVKDYQPQDDNGDEQKLEFDLYELPDKKLKELFNYVEKCHYKNNEEKKKME